MGQRSQLFIHTVNPFIIMKKELAAVKTKDVRDNLDTHLEKIAAVEEAIKIFGSGETIIVAYHHQWLYGRSMSLVVTKLLEFNKFAGRENNFFNKEFFDSPYRQYIHTPQEFLDSIQSLIGMLNDPLSEYARAGRERFHLLNELRDGETDLIETFTFGDNNDGVMIIDMTTNKYAIVNIYKQEKGVQSITNLPEMTPVGISELVKSYYNEKVVKESKTKNGIDKEAAKQNREINNKFISRAEEFKVLTSNELKAIFPAENIAGISEKQIKETIV